MQLLLSYYYSKYVASRLNVQPVFLQTNTTHSSTTI